MKKRVKKRYSPKVTIGRTSDCAKVAREVVNKLGLGQTGKLIQALMAETASFFPVSTICDGCNAMIGQPHDSDCLLEQCPYCGLHKNACDCADRNYFGEIPADDKIPYSGFLPYGKEAVDLGWFRCSDAMGETEQCEWNEDFAEADFERVKDEADWNREKKRFVASKRRRKKP